MIYSNEELLRWWKGLAKSAQLDLLARMVDRMSDPTFALSLVAQYERGKDFTPNQLAAIRKWDRS
jgi:hypothetical protein